MPIFFSIIISMNKTIFVVGIALVFFASIGIIMPSVVNAIGPPHSGACGAGDVLNTPGSGDICLPDKAGGHAPDRVPEEACPACIPPGD